jgi:hypothetical protein
MYQKTRYSVLSGTFTRGGTVSRSPNGLISHAGHTRRKNRPASTWSTSQGNPDAIKQ